MSTIGFLGPGVLGAPMVQALAAHGHEVLLWARRPEAARALVQDRIRAVDSPEEAASADIVIGCLVDDAVVRAVHGSYEPHSAQTIIEHGTFSPDTARSLAIAADERGASFIDSPVTGGPEGAIRGTLTAMAGGDAHAIDGVRGVIGCYASSVTRVGRSGTGLELKLVNQLLVTIHMLAAAEASAVLDRAGITPALAATVLTSGWADSAMLRRTLAALSSGDTSGRGATIGGLVEVQRLVAEQLVANELEPLLFGQTRDAFARATAAGLGDRDPSALVSLYGQAG